jgi:tetratricopeptide (TPR) repeat protein
VFVGDAVNLAARLQQAAAPGEVLIGERTWRLVRDAAMVEPVPPLELKGKSGPVAAFRLLGVRPDVPGQARHLDAPMVGRDAELGLLVGAMQDAVATRGCHLAVVAGAAGVGKSRLVKEFQATVSGQATVLHGRCPQYGEGLTYLPVAEVIRQAAASGGPAGLHGLLAGQERAALVVDELAGVAGTAEPTVSREEVPWAVRKLFEALARHRPLVVVLDELHWAEPALLDLVDQLAGGLWDAPLLVVGIGRPELLDQRPGWGMDGPQTTPVLLDPLGWEACGRLVGNLLGGHRLPAEMVRGIAEAAGGNPLFVEEFVAELIDRRVLVRADGHWEATAADLAGVPIPAGISALLAARLDRLEAEERAVLERASVVGLVFRRRAVVALSPEAARPAVPARLAALTRRQLVAPDGDQTAGQATAPPERDAFRFRHVLIRDVAYDALPKRRRAELHERLAAWLGQDGEADPLDQGELVGYHFEQAYRWRVQLGPVGPHEAELAGWAADRLAAGGRRALARDDPPAAVNLLGRAVDLLPAGDPQRPGLLLDLGDALAEAGDWNRAREVLAEAVDGARAAADRLLAARGSIALLYLRETTSSRGWTEEATREARRAIPLFEQAGDRAGLAQCWRLLAHVSNRRLQWSELERVGRRILDDAREAGDRRTEARMLGGISASLCLGPTPTAEAAEECRRILEELGGAPRPTMMVLDSLALCSAMLQRFDEAEELLARADAIREELAGRLWKVVGRAQFGAWTQLLSGRPVDAERALRPAYEALQRIGEQSGLLSIHASLLAEAIFAIGGRDQEAERLTEIAESAAAGSEELTAQVQWRTVRATALARKGDAGAAERLASEAAEMASATDCMPIRAWTLLALARTRRLGGQSVAARRAAHEALAVAERKGDLWAAADARTLLGELEGQPAR